MIRREIHRVVLLIKKLGGGGLSGVQIYTFQVITKSSVIYHFHWYYFLNFVSKIICIKSSSMQWSKAWLYLRHTIRSPNFRYFSIKRLILVYLHLSHLMPKNSWYITRLLFIFRRYYFRPSLLEKRICPFLNLPRQLEIHTICN